MLADDTTKDAAEVVEPKKEEVRIRPEAMIEVPAGIILRPRTESGTRTVFRPSEEYKCFSSDEWASMGHLVTDYRWLWYYAIQMETKTALLGKEIGNLQLQLSVLKDSEESTRRALDTMTGLLDKEHAARLSIHSSEKFELWAWRIGTVVGLIAAGAFGAAWGVERSR